MLTRQSINAVLRAGSARCFELALLLFAVSLVLFFVLHLMPGDSVDLLVGNNPRIEAEAAERLRQLRGLDRPILERYGCWLWGHRPGSEEGRCGWWPGDGLLRGDLGYSSVHKQAVAEVIGGRLENTFMIMVPAFFGSLLLAFPLGLFAALRRGRWPDVLVRGISFLGLSLPVHWLGMMMIWAFAVGLRWFPAGGIDDVIHPSFGARMLHAVLPISVLATFYVCRWARFSRSSILEVLELEFIDAARARGLSERRVLFGHVLPNAMIPLLTVVIQSLPGLFSGALIVERVFSYPGLGVLIFESVEADDYLVAMSVFMVFATATLLATTLADVVYWLIDPRMRAGLARRST